MDMFSNEKKTEERKSRLDKNQVRKNLKQQLDKQTAAFNNRNKDVMS